MPKKKTAKKAAKKTTKKVTAKKAPKKEQELKVEKVEQPEPRDEQDKNIRDAQYRKGLSIAFFNATNAAIALVTAGKQLTPEEALKEVVRVRDFFIEEHKEYYAATINQVGQDYDPQEAIKKLKKTKNLEQVHTVWLMFSEDERRDPEIYRVAQEMKKKYEKA